MKKYAVLICFEGDAAKSRALSTVNSIGKILNSNDDDKRYELWRITGIGNYSEHGTRVVSVSLHDCQQHPLRSNTKDSVRKNPCHTGKRRFATPSGGVYYR